MRIALIVYNQTGAGTFRRALQFGKKMVVRGHTVSLLGTSRAERLRIRTTSQDGVEIVEFPDLLWGSLRSGWDLWNTFTRICWLSTHRFDIVHAFESRPVVIFPALFAVRLYHIPLIMDWADWFGRGGSVEERRNGLMRLLLRPLETFFENTFRTRAAETTVICTTLRDKAIALGVRSETISIIPNGSDTRQILASSLADARLRVHLPVNAYFIGYVGSIFYRDAILMARAFEKAHAEFPSLRLLIVGYFPFDMRSLVDCPDAVVQTGRVTEAALSDYLAACDLCWLPLCDSGANRGRWPLKLNDYIAAGRPSVATPVGDVAALFQQEQIGLLASDEPASFAQATGTLLRDPALRASMGQHARHVAETQFDWAHLTDTLLDSYGSAIKTLRTERCMAESIKSGP